MDDHDRLIRIDERTDRIETNLDNHLAHHWKATVVLLTATLGLIAALIIALV